MFGKNIIITDNTDWTTGDIVEASLDRRQVEDHFRVSKDEARARLRRNDDTKRSIIIDLEYL
jgi:ribosomal protein S4E